MVFFILKLFLFPMQLFVKGEYRTLIQPYETLLRPIQRQNQPHQRGKYYRNYSRDNIVFLTGNPKLVAQQKH